MHYVPSFPVLTSVLHLLKSLAMNVYFFRFINIITLFSEAKFYNTTFIITIYYLGLLVAYNECDFLDFDILVLYHFKFAYLRFY